MASPMTPAPLGLMAALVPVAALVGLLGLSFFLFGDAAAGGPNQIALVFCSIIAIFVAEPFGRSPSARSPRYWPKVSLGR